MNAMLIADVAIREEGTGKVSLIGIFENITAPVFPCVHPLLFVYVKLTDAEGRYDFELELIRLDNATRLGHGQAGVDAPNRMAVGEVLFRLDNLAFPAPGLYEFRLLANGHFVGSKTFRVLHLGSPGG